MNFAKKQLEKYGWSEGKGLGKDENGIAVPLKAKIKHSLNGIGYNPAADFTEHWWSTLYNKAASSLEVKNKNDKTKIIRRKSKEEFEITNSTWKLRKKKKENETVEEEYPDFFVKTAVIGTGGEKTTRVTTKVSDTESEDEGDLKDTSKMTDEELFAACQGRTAHKGARHGLRALGKLARIEEQERILLQQAKYSGYSHHDKFKNNNLEIVDKMNKQNDKEINTKKHQKKRKQRNSFENVLIVEEKIVSESKVPKKNQCRDSVANNENGELSESKIKTITELNTHIGNSVAADVLKRKKKKRKGI